MRRYPAVITPLLIAAFLALGSGEARAWGATGHRLIGLLAIASLPQEIPGFLRGSEAAAMIAEIGREADRSKGAGTTHDAERDPGHFINLDDEGKVAGKLALDALPPTREAYDTLLRAAGSDQYKAGYVYYAIIDGWQQLAEDFAHWRVDDAAARMAKRPGDRAWFARDRRLRELLTIRDLGYWSHFVGDASQPLHVSMHYNGWGPFPNPEGYTTATTLHAFFEGAFVRSEVSLGDMRAHLAPYRDCRCGIAARVAAYIGATHAQVVPLYALEKAGGFRDGDPRGKDFAAARLAAASAELRDMIVAAWRQSLDGKVGYPPVAVRDVLSGKVNPIGPQLGLD
jgi:hypothetical protein